MAKSALNSFRGAFHDCCALSLVVQLLANTACLLRDQPKVTVAARGSPSYNVVVMKVLVTGGAGFIGSHLTELLLHRGHDVIVVDDESTGSAANLAAVRGHQKFTYIRGSVNDSRLVQSVLADVDEVYHLAAAVGVALIAQEPIKTIETNIYPTQLLLEELTRQIHADQRPRRFFLASSSEVYGKNPKKKWTEEDDLVFGSTSRPRWSYGVSKAIDEFLALACWKERRLPVVVGRFFNVVGPRQTGSYGMVLPRFVDAALAEGSLVIHDDGAQQRCFAHVSDVASAVLALMQTPSAFGRVFNIGDDQSISILELARQVIAAAGTDATIEFQNYADAYGADFEDIRRRVPDLSRLKATIPFQPRYELGQIIEELLEDRREQGKQGEE